MMVINLILCILSLIVLIKCADYAIKYSSRLAKILQFPEFLVSFFIIALISVLPEATVAIISAIRGQPELGLGTLIGSNVADLTLVFGIVALFSARGIKVKSKILGNIFYYLILILFPLILGFDGEFSRIDGTILILVGLLFFAKITLDSRRFKKKYTHNSSNHKNKGSSLKTIILLILSLGILLLSAFLTVKFATNFANNIRLPAILIGLTILAIGTCLPELIFSLKAVRKNHHSLALGDILGTVIADATIILGIVAVISPFQYDPINIYTTGTAMFLGGLLVTTFMKSEKTISKTEGVALIIFYILFITIEFFINHLAGL